LQPELIVNYCKLVIVSVDSPMLSKDIKDGLGATFPFLSDEDKKVITELEIVDTTDRYHPLAIPYTFVLERDRSINKIYNGWWHVGRPTVEELRKIGRASCREREETSVGDVA